MDHEKSTKNRKSLQGNARKIKIPVSEYKYYIPANRIFRKKNEFFDAGFWFFVKPPPCSGGIHFSWNSRFFSSLLQILYIPRKLKTLHRLSRMAFFTLELMATLKIIARWLAGRAFVHSRPLVAVKRDEKLRVPSLYPISVAFILRPTVVSYLLSVLI